MAILPPDLGTRRDAIHDRVVTRGAAMRRTRRFVSVTSGIVVVALAVGVAWARIDETSGARLSAQVIVAATSSADTARFHAVEEVQIGTTPGAFDETGAVDFKNQRGDEIARLLPTGPTALPPADRRSAQARWIGDDIYTNGGAGAAEGWSLVNAAKVRAAAACLAKVDVLSEVTASFIVNPVDVLSGLRAHGADLRRVGVETIRGVSTTHWRSEATDSESGSCRPSNSNSVHSTTRETLDVYTDAHNRALRIGINETTTTIFPRAKPVTQTFQLTTDFSDFGAPVNVQAPPADQITDQTAAFIGEQLGTGSVKGSQWHESARGTIGTTPWVIDSARTSTGWNCYDLSDTPGSAQTGIDATTGDSPKHNGHATACLLAGNEPLSMISGPVGLFIDSTHADQRVLVGAVTGLGAARLIFKDGTTQTLNVDPNTWLFDWSGPASRAPVRIQVGSQSCRVDTQTDQPNQPNWTINTASSCTMWAA